MFIPDPGSEFDIPDPGSASESLRILTKKIVSKISEKWSELFIPDPDTNFFIPDPHRRIQEY